MKRENINIKILIKTIVVLKYCVNYSSHIKTTYSIFLKMHQNT